MAIEKRITADSSYRSGTVSNIKPKVEFGKYSDDLKAFIDNLDPESSKVYVLVSAMGAGEHWGPNKNGDFFPEQSLIKQYPTFYNAKVFKHHINKDQAHSFGDVVFSGWNPRMKRVELIIAVDY